MSFIWSFKKWRPNKVTIKRSYKSCLTTWKVSRMFAKGGQSKLLQVLFQGTRGHEVFFHNGSQGGPSTSRTRRPQTHIDIHSSSCLNSLMFPYNVILMLCGGGRVSLTSSAHDTFDWWRQSHGQCPTPDAFILIILGWNLIQIFVLMTKNKYKNKKERKKEKVRKRKKKDKGVIWLCYKPVMIGWTAIVSWWPSCWWPSCWWPSCCLGSWVKHAAQHFNTSTGVLSTAAFSWRF